MGAKLSGDIAMEMDGTPAEIGLDVASKLLGPVVRGGMAAGMGAEQLADLLLGMLCGVCAEFGGLVDPSVVLLRLQHVTEIMKDAPVPPKTGGFPVPVSGTVQ